MAGFIAFLDAKRRPSTNSMLMRMAICSILKHLRVERDTHCAPFISEGF
jgi:hypothetical protein